MNAGATLNAVDDRIVEAGVEPMVLIDGLPDPRFVVENWQATSPLDQHSATLRIETLDGHWPDRDRYQSACVTIALPLRLSDASIRWPVLLQGRLDASAENLDGASADRWKIIDDWNQKLSRPLTQTWWETNDESLKTEGNIAYFLVGDQANRSLHSHKISGQDVHVLRQAGQSWTLQTATKSLWAWTNLDAVQLLVPDWISRLPLHKSIDLTRNLGDILTELLNAMDAHLRRTISRDGNTIVQKWTIEWNRAGRVVRLPQENATQRITRILSLKNRTPVQAARVWTARCHGWMVESTFDLAHGWDTSLEGETDATYSASTNPDFIQFADVYRLWVLNEDGHFSAAPFHAPAYDCSILFGEPVRAEPLCFLPCVTTDRAGRQLGAVVEMSLDSGATWSFYPGQFQIRSDRAAVYLDDSVLPSAFLSAAKTDHARIRMTASLQNPMPVTAVRWRGNPFAGTLKPLLLDAGAAFRFRRISPASIHYAAVQAGTLASSVIDETLTLSQWLNIRSSEANQENQSDGASASLLLAGTWSSLCAGDRLRGLSSQTNTDARVRSIQCNWSTGSDKTPAGQTTQIQLEW